MAKKRYKYSFTKKKTYQRRSGILYSGADVRPAVFGAAICSLVMSGQGGMYLGAMGILALGLSVYGFILGLKSFSEQNRAFLYSKIGSVANGVLMVIWIALFLVGIS